MQFTRDDLEQINKAYLASLTHAQLLRLSELAFMDIKIYFEMFNTTPENSSRPSSSMPPWGRNCLQPQSHDRSENEEIDDEDASLLEEDLIPEAIDEYTNKEDVDQVPSDLPSNTDSSLNQEETHSDQPTKRKPGRQPGATGYSRSSSLPIHNEIIHLPQVCKGCNEKLDADDFVKIGGHCTLDIECDGEENPGISVIHTQHIYAEYTCAGCGFVNSSRPNITVEDENWNVRISQYHLVGPSLASLIVYLAMEMRLSRQKIKKMLQTWLHITLSTSVINQTIHETARACEPLEQQIIDELNQADLNNVDETPWWERGGGSLYLWVFVSSFTILFTTGRRTKEFVASILLKTYAGILMTDGYCVYREYTRRMRCWAHLLRKAKGLIDSLDPKAQAFGKKTKNLLNCLIQAIYEARDGPPVDLMGKYKSELSDFMLECENILRDEIIHPKCRELAVEFLNDSYAIWMPLKYPFLCFTNNLAERALRHWVIYRKLSLGTQGKQGSRAVCILASVIGTCNLRSCCPWKFLAGVLKNSRANQSIGKLPSLESSKEKLQEARRSAA